MATRHLRGKTGKNRHSSFFTVFPGPVALIFSTARAVKTGTQKKVIIYIYIPLFAGRSPLCFYHTRCENGKHRFIFLLCPGSVARLFCYALFFICIL